VLVIKRYVLQCITANRRPEHAVIVRETKVVSFTHRKSFILCKARAATLGPKRSLVLPERKQLLPFQWMNNAYYTAMVDEALNIGR
jgi:hypothetical protein